MNRSLPRFFAEAIAKQFVKPRAFVEDALGT